MQYYTTSSAHVADCAFYGGFATLPLVKPVIWVLRVVVNWRSRSIAKSACDACPFGKVMRAHSCQRHYGNECNTLKCVEQIAKTVFTRCHTLRTFSFLNSSVHLFGFFLFPLHWPLFPSVILRWRSPFGSEPLRKVNQNLISSWVSLFRTAYVFPVTLYERVSVFPRRSSRLRHPSALKAWEGAT